MTAMSSEKFVLRPNGAIQPDGGDMGLNVCFKADGISKDCASSEVQFPSMTSTLDLGKVMIGGEEYRMVPVDMKSTKVVRDDLPVVRLMNADASGMKCLQTGYDKLLGEMHRNI